MAATEREPSAERQPEQPVDRTAGTDGSILSSDLGKGYLKYVVTVYAVFGVAIGLLVLLIASTGNPIQPAGEAPGTEWEELTTLMLGTYMMLGTPFFGSLLAVVTAISISSSARVETSDAYTLAGAGAGIGTFVMVAASIFLASSEVESYSTELALDTGNLLTGGLAAGVIAAIVAAATVYAHRSLRP